MSSLQYTQPTPQEELKVDAKVELFQYESIENS